MSLRVYIIRVPEIMGNSWESNMSWEEVLSVIKIEAYTKYQESILAGFHAKTAITESIKL